MPSIDTSRPEAYFKKVLSGKYRGLSCQPFTISLTLHEHSLQPTECGWSARYGKMFRQGSGRCQAKNGLPKPNAGRPITTKAVHPRRHGPRCKLVPGKRRGWMGDVFIGELPVVRRSAP